METKAYENHREASFLGRLEGLCDLGYPLDDSAWDQNWEGGGHQGRAVARIWVKDKRLPLCLK